MKIVFLTIILLAVAVLMIGVKIFFVKGGTFKIGHAHDIADVHKNKNN
ncbi:MAG: hypothetical protein NC216_04500 [Bacteroides sp.]|nr:hypothetical protein [Lachnospiraceae bacterium]MCM1389582.1 hypothetical protein [Bacteroides sp.]